MDINRLREFLVLSEELNYSKAANLLFITQPVLSRHVRDLEETFGGQLFVRDTHKVQLTEFGSICADQVRDVVKAFDSAMIRISNASDTSSDTLSVGFLDYAVRPFLNQFVTRFHSAHPNIEIDYSTGNLDDLADAVINDKMDLAFITYVGSDSFSDRSLESELVFEDRLVAVFPPTHPCGEMESITIEELSIHPLLSYSKAKTPYTSAFHSGLFESRGLPMNVVKEVASFESGLFYVKTGIGVLLIPQHLSPFADDLSIVPISNENCTVPLNLVWKKQNPKKSLQTYVRDFKLFYKSIV